MKPGSRRCTSRTHPFSSQCSYGTLSQEQEQVRWNCNFRFFSFFLNQVHPHLQTWLGRTSYSGHWETQLRSVGLIPFDINEKRLFSFGDEERQSRIRRKLGVPTIGKTWQRWDILETWLLGWEKGDLNLLCFSHSLLGYFPILTLKIYKLQTTLPSFMLLLALEWSTGTPMPSFLSPGAGWTSFFEFERKSFVKPTAVKE